jgi:hypothetical protein
MRIFTTSRGLDPATLVPGEDLVLDGDEAHGLDLAPGVLAHDYLDPETRLAIDDACPDVLDRWAAASARWFTSEGICLPWVWEFELLTDAVLPALCHGLGIRRAVERHQPSSLTVVDADPLTRHVVFAAWGGKTNFAGRGSPPTPRAERARPRLARRARQAALRSVVGVGAPSVLRRDSVLVLGYWHLMPLLDRMLSEPGWRPAIALGKPANGPWRNLRACAQGGWLGLPGPRERARARRRALAMIERAAASDAPALEAFGLDLGPALHERTLELARRRLARDVARAPSVRRAFSKRRARRLVIPADTPPDTRLVTQLAQEAGIPVLMVQHGVMLLGQPDREGEICDDVAVWSSPERWLRRHAFRRPAHVVGFSFPHEPLPPKRWSGRGSPRVVVLGAGSDPCTARLDVRMPMRHYDAALEAIGGRLPGATVVLRPHPSHDIAPAARIMERFPRHRIDVDRSSGILELLHEADLCVGVASTATVQSVLVGTPVVVLNVSGFDWAWPLGGDSAVPVAHSAAELATWLQRWAAGEELPGRHDLLASLGFGRADPTEGLLRVIGPPLRHTAVSSDAAPARRRSPWTASR